ncbi:hypothetical protein JNW88_23185 [Micromonospora sp. ATA32]|nr:hypothetical protein [Micromonospora sp. ATA32]
MVTHPAEVIRLYRDLVGLAILNSADKRRYRRAVALLPALRAAYQAAADPAVPRGTVHRAHAPADVSHDSRGRGLSLM